MTNLHNMEMLVNNLTEFLSPSWTIWLPWKRGMFCLNAFISCLAQMLLGQHAPICMYDPIRLVCLLLSQTPQQLIVTLTIR